MTPRRVERSLRRRLSEIERRLDELEKQALAGPWRVRFLQALAAHKAEQAVDYSAEIAESGENIAGSGEDIADPAPNIENQET